MLEETSEHPLTRVMADPSQREGLLNSFLSYQKVEKLRDWQAEFLSRPLEEQTNSILQLPPGAGKTLLAQWILLEQLAAYPAGRVLFAVPLRVLARQLFVDLSSVLSLVANYTGQQVPFKVQLAEGPGAVVNLIANNVVVCTYEHAAGELKKNPREAKEGRRFVSLVVVDEIHNIAKADRGMVVDDVLFFSQLRADTDRRHIPAVLGMSGTLPTWVVSRLVGAYPELFRNVYTPAVLGIAQEAKARAKRILLDPAKFDTQTTLVLCRDLVKSLLRERLEKPQAEWRRLVVFMSSVAEAELGFALCSTDRELTQLAKANRQTNRYKAPKVKLLNSLRALAGRFSPELEFSENPDLPQLLESSGIYLHHAQLRGQRENPTTGQEGWSDAIQDQLAHGDFVAVFCTSTLSVGINLNSTQVGVLGPNTMWSIDQAEQMIGRVGRVDRDAARSFVCIVDSPLYSAPGVSSVFAPLGWFVPRFAAALSFLSGCPPVPVNFDLRGFFSPSGAPPLSLPSPPGSGVLPLALSLGLLSPSGGVSPCAVAALALCKQDQRALPATLYLISLEEPSPSLVLLWGLLCVRPPGSWEKLFSKQAEQKLSQTSSQPNQPKDRKQAAELVALYGDFHESYPGDPQVVGRANTAQFLVFFSHLFWCVGLFPSSWYSGDPLGLFDLVVSLAGFLSSVWEDRGVLVDLSRSSGFLPSGFLGSLEAALDYLASFACYSGGPPVAVEHGIAQAPEDTQRAYKKTMAEIWEETGQGPWLR